MARKLANGAIVSADGHWVWDSSGWKAIGQPTSKSPGNWTGDERKEVGRLMGSSFSAVMEAKTSAKQLLDLVVIHGSLAAAEASLPQPAPGVASAGGSAPTVSRMEVKTYRDAKEYENDAKRRLAQGWQVQGQSQSRGNVNMGRTVLKAGIFLPWAIMRPSRKGDPLTVTWALNPPSAEPVAETAAPAQDGVLDQLRKLGELRDAGVVTEDEFAQKKEELLSRL